MVLCIAKFQLFYLARRWHVAAINAVESDASSANARRLWLVPPLWALGIAGLLRDSWPGAPHLPGVNLHAIFGAMLWLIVVAQYSHASLAGPPLSSTGVHELCRRLSRWLYLLLYMLFGASLLVRLAAIVWNGGAQGMSHPAVLPAPENLRDYAAYGAFALLTIRVLAAAQCQTLKRMVVP
jgi:cytochrome b561